MDGVFMFKLVKLVVLLLAVLGVFYAGTLMKDRNVLHDQLIRLHVVADSDDPQAQEVKLQVRDAVLEKVDTIVNKASSKEEVAQLLQQNLSELEETANSVLEKAKQIPDAVVSLKEETFPTRHYDTFSLPAGVYDSLKVTIGRGEGKNWWCVVFPQLCIPAASQDVEDVAVGAGFSDQLSKTLTTKDGYEIRFWLLDCMGKVQNWLHKRW